MVARIDIVNKILGILQVDLDPGQAEKQWFYDIRRTGGMRLTDAGYGALIKSSVKSWSVPIDKRSLTKKNMLAMNRYIEWPYYIKINRSEIVLFGDQEAVMAHLYGDIDRWLANKNTGCK